MHNISVAIDVDIVRDDTIDVLLDQLKRGKIYRVFLCGAGFLYSEKCKLIDEPEKYKKMIQLFKDEGFETGIWISSLGHGCMLPGTKLSEDEKKFTNLRGVNGGVAEHGFCPSDENFRRVFCEKIKKLAELGPDLIQLDDDYRLNYRGGIICACFCDKHLKEYYERIGEELPLEEISKYLLTGGKNKYRTAYMEMCRDTLLDFAKVLRSAVDEVNPNIRLNSCGTIENWDASGTDMIEIAKAFAGNTRPFMRTNAGPYWHKGTTYKTLIDVIEYTRMQAQWCKGEDIELFGEGDTFPRPRYNLSASLLELFDMSIMASGGLEGDLKYMFDYFFTPDYESGYIDRHIRNEKLRDELTEVFSGKPSVGPRVISTMHIAENRDVPKEYEECRVSMRDEYRYLALLSANSIPTTFGESEYPALVIGENAKYVTEKDLENGAVLDVKAAEILRERGFDTGLISAEKANVETETYNRIGEKVISIETKAFYELSVKDGAEVLSVFNPNNTPSSYIYNKFCVMAVDLTYAEVNNTNYSKNYFFNYYRQADLVYALEKICGKKLPAVCRKNPMLYTLTSKDDNSMAVLFANVHEDGVYDGKVELDREYKSIRFVNCKGRMEGSSVIIDEIQPFGVAAFEVK